MFLRLQTNEYTELSAQIFLQLTINKYHHFPKETLVNHLFALLKEMKTKLNISSKLDPFPIFIDEAQLFCPNVHKFLCDNYSVTPYNSSHKNDLLSLIMAAYSEIDKSRIIVTGNAFSSDIITQFHSGIIKQDQKQIQILPWDKV